MDKKIRAILCILMLVLTISLGCTSDDKNYEKKENDDKKSVSFVKIIGFKYDIRYKSDGDPDYIKAYVKCKCVNVYSYQKINC